MSEPSNKLQTLSAIRFGVATITVSLGLLCLWMYIAPLHGAIVASGLVKPSKNRKLVQHMEGGVIKKIFVKNGDTVQSGQALVELEDAKIDATYQVSFELLAYETVKKQRLDAEQQLQSRFSLSQNEQNSSPGEYTTSAYQRELKIFSSRRALLDEQLASYTRQLKAVSDEQTALHMQMESSRRAAGLAREELSINEALVRDKYISRARLIGLERTVAEYGAKQGEHEAALAASEQRKQDIALRMTTIRSEYQRAAAEDFKESQAKLVQLREQLRPALESLSRKTLVAPVAGKIVGLRLNAAGEIVMPREPLMEIVPSNEDLIVEAKVGVDSIRHLRVGQATEMRFTTFNSRTTTMVLGDLTYVSADAMQDKDSQPYYVIQALPRAASLRQANIPALLPGMAAEVFVQLEPRTVIDYLMSPITDTIRRSMREP